MKKVISMLLALVMVLGIMSVGTMAAVGDVIMTDDFEDYSVNGGTRATADYWSRATDGFVTGYGDTGYAIKMAYATSRPNLEQNYKQKVNITAGEYLFTAKVKADRVVDEGVTLTPKISLGDTSTFTDSKVVKFDAVRVTTEWQTVGGRFTAPATKQLVAQAIGFRVEGTVSANTNFYFDDVQIVETAPIYNVTAKYDNTKGSVVLSADEIEKGGNVTVTVTPNEGCTVARVVAGNARLEATGNVYTISNVAADTEVIVGFVTTPAAGTIVVDNFEQYISLAEVQTGNPEHSGAEYWNRARDFLVEDNGNNALGIDTNKTGVRLNNLRRALSIPAGNYNLTFRAYITNAQDNPTITATVDGELLSPAGVLSTTWNTYSFPVSYATDKTIAKNQFAISISQTPNTTGFIYVDDIMFVPVAPAGPTVYNVTINEDANAVTSVAADTTTGEAVNFTVAPKFGYYISSITIGGNAFTGFEAYKGGTYSTGEVTADTAIVVTTASYSANDKGVSTEVATLPAVFTPAATEAVTFGKVLDNDATSFGVELTKDGQPVYTYHGGGPLFKANTKNANGQYAVEFTGLAAGTYTVRTYVIVDGVKSFGIPTTFTVAE